MKRNNGYTVESVAQSLSSTFHQYLRAQYHIWDESLIRERDRLFHQPGITCQPPYIEATPAYHADRTYEELNIPKEARQVIGVAASHMLQTGIPKKPYFHQAEALELYLTGKHDLVAATGTGSGKTETFLMPIIGSLALERANRSDSWKQPGVRALVLYPMNALVNDQLSRLRKVLGNQHVMDALRGTSSRYATFGMYTGRTPYANVPDADKNRKRLRDPLKALYIDDVNQTTRELLLKNGKWPAKDIEAFIASGYVTGPNDAEMISRHEMQRRSPDILVTNYSMLEYMMLRPIEAKIFEQTRDWLGADPRNTFTVVLDEAHMYRGSAGAEVAYLLRRLHARLGVDRSRVRYILTSASFGAGDQASAQALDFAKKLSGGEGEYGFKLITGRLIDRPAGDSATDAVRTALAAFDPSSLHGAHADFALAADRIGELARNLGLAGKIGSVDLDSLRTDTYRVVDQLPVAHFVANAITSNPLPLSELLARSFGSSDDSHAALESLLALMAFARDKSTERSFASLRSHLFFRGLQGLFVCTNRNCSAALGDYQDRLLGTLHSTSTFQCKCGARVYELLTHRDCGAAYIRGYVSAQKDFLWHQPSQRTWANVALTEVHAFVLREEEVKSADGCIKWLHTPTGRLLNEPPSGELGEFLPLIWGTKPIFDRGATVLSVDHECPACMREFGADPKVMDLATKGEAPFSHLIKTQVATQPASLPISKQSPNAGRKSLLFSDGRQKAARLARDIPREIELDVFRQLLLLAASKLSGRNLEPTLNARMYVSFVDALHGHAVSLFDGADRRQITRDTDEYIGYYQNDFHEAAEAMKSPSAFKVSLLRQLCSSFYSVGALLLARVEPTRRALKVLSEELKIDGVEDIRRIAVPWIQRMLSRYAFDESISQGVRNRAWPHPVKVTSAQDGFTKRQKSYLASKGYDIGKLSSSLATALCDPNTEHGFFVSASKVKLEIAYQKKWAQCITCKSILAVDWWGVCAHCQSGNISWVSPSESTYLRARKGFWHDPVVAVLEHNERPVNLVVEEHTAQLSYKDPDSASTTTEEFERQFRDILIHKEDTSIDVLSSTTTMEVGIDIGSLIAVGMRNVPPMRQNYQQRAGRAGRRGSSVSSVITYAQNGAHDGHYFSHPEGIISGNPPKPILDTSNDQIIVRHIRAQLIQDYFGPIAAAAQISDLYAVLGATSSFYDESSPTSITDFSNWIASSVKAKESIDRVKKWLPSGSQISVEGVAREFIDKLEAIRPTADGSVEDGLLDYMFARGLLPSYAFPRDLCSLHIEHYDRNLFPPVVIDEKPQQSLSVALSEYAPGKQLVVNKKTYKVGTIAASSPFTEVNRARALFDAAKHYVHCSECLYTAGFATNEFQETPCPQCGNDSLECVKVVTPEVVYPSNGQEVNEYDDEQTFSRASAAQLPLPETVQPFPSIPFSVSSELTTLRSHPLVMVNRGPETQDGVEGFLVCSDCGKVWLDETTPKAHSRDYNIQPMAGVAAPRYCNGTFERVYLGYAFVSDVMVIRFKVQDPLRFDLMQPRFRRPLEDALTSLADTLVLAMSRVMDIDVREINAGHRFAVYGTQVFADIFLYDTLSGGAGYAYQAGQNFEEIFKVALEILQSCSCDASCESCLRHYGNRFNHSVLDRHLALDIARYIHNGSIPPDVSPGKSNEVLTPLAELLRLAGWEVMTTEDGGLSARIKQKHILVKAVPSLRSPPTTPASAAIVYFSEYELKRDLASAYAELA